MKKDCSLLLITLVGAGLYCLPTIASAESRSAANSFGIVPKPFSIEAKKENPFAIKADTLIIYQGEASKPSAEYLRDRIAAATGIHLAVRNSGGSNAIVLRIDPERVEFNEKDAYTFESGGENITITGKSASGLFYGIQTLFQLLPPGIYGDTPVADMNLTVDALTIQDKPSMGKIRGLHVDISRHFRTKEELKKIIDSMAMHKLNTLHLHLSDDEGWRVEIKAYPKLTSVGAIGNRSDRNAPAAFLTQEDVKELCAYAARRHVAIIPEIDMPGHMGAVIKAYPELKHPKEERDPAKVIRGDAMGRDFAKKVLAEIKSLFDPEYIHIGCDEVNLKSPVELYSKAELVDFAREVTTFVKEELKKKPIVWDDAFTTGFEDKETVVHWWRYGKKFWWKKMDTTVDEGLNLKQQPFILSPACWTYFDMKNEGKGGWAGRISPAEMYNWDPYGDMLGVTPETRQLAHGAIACTWSEEIPTMKIFGDRTYPRLAGFSERVWSGGKSENPSILGWVDYRDKVLIPFQLKRYDALGLWYWSKDKPDLLKTLPDEKKALP
jgi:hexosaminidase